MSTSPPARSISLTINFEYNSSVLTDQAVEQLSRLGEALQSAELSGTDFKLEGHTDAVGSHAFNLVLSQDRSESAGRFLFRQFGIQPDRVQQIGKGETELLDPDNPKSGKNRRVTITALPD